MRMEVFHLGTKMGRERIQSEMWRDLTDKQISVLGVPLEQKHWQRVQREMSRSYNGILLQWWISEVMPCAVSVRLPVDGDCFTTLLGAHAQGTPQEQESGYYWWDDAKRIHLVSFSSHIFHAKKAIEYFKLFKLQPCAQRRVFPPHWGLVKAWKEQRAEDRTFQAPKTLLGYKAGGGAGENFILDVHQNVQRKQKYSLTETRTHTWWVNCNEQQPVSFVSCSMTATELGENVWLDVTVANS